MTVQEIAFTQHCALVSRPGLPASYLLLSETGKADWILDPQGATPFVSMREATRAAMRLPSWVKAYSLPLEAEVAFTRAH